VKPSHALSNVEVRFVSLVNRASVRDPAAPDEPMRFALRKSASTNPKRKPKKRRKGAPNEGVPMAKQARQIIKKLDSGETVTGADVTAALQAATAEIRKADPTISEYEAACAAIRKSADLQALQQRYSEVTNPTAAEIRKAEAERHGVPSVGAEASRQLRKAADESRRPGESEYDALQRAVRENPDVVGRYRNEVA
jgi:hypothetical protein